MPELQPTRFGKYLLLEKIAVGGMAQLYRAKITGVQGFEKLIAIKMILPHLVGEKDLISHFIDEAKLAALLNHQNIVQIYDFGTMEDSYFIAMEYLFGKDLRDILRTSKEKGLPLSLEEALYISARICSGLDYAHKLKDFQGKPLDIIHRDISPQNIFITYEGEVKIVDFGIAKAASQSTVTQHGMIKGKVAYMSPEQAMGEKIDHRSDIFSAGIILYEMLTHQPMFTGDTLHILAKVREADYQAAEQVAKGLHPKIYKVLHLALAKAPEERYQSCGEMLSDIEECISELSLRPSARGLQDFVKRLFEKEAEAARPESPAPVPPPPAPAPLTQAAQIEKIKQEMEDRQEEFEAEEEAPEKPVSPERKKRGLLYGGIAAALIVIVAVFAFWPKGKPTPVVVVEPPRPAPPPAVVKDDTAKPPVETAQKPEKTPGVSAEVDQLVADAVKVMDKNPEEAKNLLLKAVGLDPKFAPAQFQLGRAYLRLNDAIMATESFLKTTELAPKSADAFFNLGYIHWKKESYAKAEEMFSRAVSLSPGYLDQALFNLAIVQQQLGKKEQCRENLERAVQVNPKNEKAKEALERIKKSS